MFVYGSLRRGEKYHHLLQNAVFEGVASTLPQYRLLDLGWYPGLVGNGTTAVVGEVFRVSSTMREQLDTYEDHPGLFRRTPVTLADGSEAEIYVFVAPIPAHAREVSSGDWTQRAKP